MALDATKAVATRETALFLKDYASGNAFPALAAWGTSPGAGWDDVGGTTNRMQFDFNIQTNPLYADQSPTPVLEPFVSEILRVIADLIEATALNFQKATGQGAITTVAAGAGTRGSDTLAISGNPSVTYKSTLMRFQAQDLESFDVMLWKSKASGSPSFNVRPTALGAIELMMTAVPDSANSNRIASIRDTIPAA